MEDKASLVILLILGLVLGQTYDVEAKSCCPNTTSRNCYNVCRLSGTSREACAKLCGCIIISGTTCPPNYPKHFCELGCASSMCGSTISNGADEEVGVEEAGMRCNNACSELCKNVPHNPNSVLVDQVSKK